MFKRFTARLLILLQVYNCVFQGVAHANVIQAHHAVRDEIYLHTAPSKDGSLRIALGTNRDGYGGGQELLDVIEVPSYQTLSKASNPQQSSARFPKKLETMAVGKDLSLNPPVMPVLSLSDSVSAMDAIFDDGVLDDACTPALFSKYGVTRSPEGAHFTLQGLEIFINNAGEALIQGTQTDFSMPIFLSWGGAVILSDVHAKALQISAPKIFGRGKSIIEELVLEGTALEGTSTFTNGGSLTAKELFLKNLTSENNGSIMAPRFLVDGQLKSKGSLESDELIVEEDGVLKLDATSTAAIKRLFLSRGGDLENHTDARVDVLETSGGILTNHGTLSIGEIAADSAFQAVHNRHLLSVERGDIKTANLENAGTLIAEASDFQVISGRSLRALKAKTLVVDEEFTNESTGSLAAEAVSGTGHFHNLGRVETDSQLSVGVKQFSNHGSVKAKSITGQDALLAFTNLEDSRIAVVEGINFAPTTKVTHKGELTAKDLSLVSDNTSQYGELNVEKLTLTGAVPFANHGVINAKQLAATTGVINYQELNASESTHLAEDLTIEKDATANLHGLMLNGLAIKNAGRLMVVGTQRGIGGLSIINSGIASIDDAVVSVTSSQFNFFDNPNIQQYLKNEAKRKIIFLNFESQNLAKLRAEQDLANKERQATQHLTAIELEIEAINQQIQAIKESKPDIAILELQITCDNTHAAQQAKDLKEQEEKLKEASSKKEAIKFEMSKCRDQTANIIGSIDDAVEKISLSQINIDNPNVLQYLKDQSRKKLILLNYASIEELRTAEDFVDKQRQAAQLLAAIDLEIDAINQRIQAIKDSKPDIVVGEPYWCGLHRQTVYNNSHANQQAKDLKEQAEKLREANRRKKAIAFEVSHSFDKKIEEEEEKLLQQLATQSYTPDLLQAASNVTGTRLYIVNQVNGHLTLKSGYFIGELANDGTLTQDHAYTQWLTSAPGEFNRGTWQVKGSLGLLGYQGKDVGKIEVEDTLHVDASIDALTALDALSKVKAARVSINAPQIANAPTPARQEKVYPWPLEMVIAGDVTNAFDISAPSLKIQSRIFKTSGNIYAHSGLFDLSAEYGVETNDAIIGGRDGAKIRAKTLSVNNQKVATGKAIPEPTWKRSELGVYSEEGLVDVAVTEKLSCKYGELKGTHFVIKAPELENIAGLICGTTPKLQSVLDVQKLVHKRDDTQGTHYTYSYQRGVTYWQGDKDWCHCCGTRPWRCGNGCIKQITHTNYFETSEEATILANGPLDLTYETLQTIASSFLAGGRLAITVKGGGAVKAERTIEEQDLSGAAIPAISDTSIIGRNGKDSRILAAEDIEAALKRANISAVMHGQNIHVKAAMLAMSNLGLAPQQQAQFVDLFMQASGSKALRQIGDGSLDTVLHLTYKDMPPLVVLGKDAARHLSHDAIIDMQMTGRALHQIMGTQVFTLYRGVAGLGLSISDFFMATTNLVRSHKDTVSQRLLIKAGDKEEEREVLSNPTLCQEDLLATKLPALFVQFSSALETLESEQRALDALKSKPRFVSKPMLAIPASDVERGISATGKVVIESETTLKVATSIKAEIIQLLAADKATIESTVVHFQNGENSWEVLDRTSLVALKTLIIKSPTIHFKAVNTHSGEESFFIADVIFDEAVATTSVTVTRQRSKRETVTTTDVYTQQNTSSHSSGGTAHIITKALVQEGVKNVNVSISGSTPDVLPYVEQRDVHDTRHVTVDVQTHKRGGFFGGLFGGGVKKSYHSSSSSAISRGSENAGRFFKAMADRYKATNPSFTAVRSDITAPSVEISAGVNHHQFVEQTSSSGAIWNKSSITTEKHKVHVNPNFGGAVHIHSPDVVVERVRGSGLLPGLYSESPVQYRDMVDTHEHKHQSQKSLTAGAQLLIKLAMSIAMGNPCGAGLMGMVMSAGVTTLCSDAAVCLVENDGDPARAMEALGERNIGKSMLMSMASAGIGSSLGLGSLDTSGLSTGDLITAYAKQELIKASVNATLAATIDGQDLGQAMLQGVVMAGINTAAAFGAHKIGDLQKPASVASTSSAATAEPIGYTTHKLLHTALGTGLGASMAAVTDQDIGMGATSGGFGALVGSIMTDAMVDDKDTKVTAQRMAQMSDLLTATLALGVGLDPVSAYLAAHNASENNFSRHRMNPIDSLVKAVEEGMTPKDGEEATPEQKEYKHGQDQFVMENLEQATVQKGGDLSEQEYVQVIESSRKQYAVEYTAQKSSEMLGHAMVGASELIPGMHGVNKAWMAVVNHARGELPKDALFDEVLGGVTSSLTDAAIMMATMGASHYYSSASRLVAKGGQVLGGLKKGSLGSAAFDKEALMQHPLMKGKIGPDRQLYAPEHIHNPHTPYSGGYQKSFVTTQEEIYYRVYSGKSTVGRFLTKTPPTSSAYAREALALPVENTAEFIQQVIVPKGTLLQRSRALPAFEKRGGAEQFESLHKDIPSSNFSVGEKFQ